MCAWGVSMAICAHVCVPSVRRKERRRLSECMTRGH